MTSPRVGAIRPPTIFMSVVLPQPLMPTKATNSPAAISRLTSSSASTTSPLRATYPCCTPRMVRIGPAARASATFSPAVEAASGLIIGSRILQTEPCRAALQRTTMTDVPGNRPALAHSDREEEQCAHTHQQNDRAEHQRRVEESRREDDEIAEALIRSHEFADDRTDQCEIDRDPRAAENPGQGVWKLEPAEIPQSAHAHRARQLGGLLVDRPETGVSVDEDREERDQERDQDFRFEPETEPQQQQRRDRHFWRDLSEQHRGPQDHALHGTRS